jgi:hypothetical protein
MTFRHKMTDNDDAVPITEKIISFVISGFCRGVNEIFALL